MAKSMQAVVAYGPGDYRLEERPVPKPRPGEVVIRVKNTGICASDLKCYLGSTGAWGDAHHEGYVPPPVTPGMNLLAKWSLLEKVPSLNMIWNSAIMRPANKLYPAGNAGFANRLTHLAEQPLISSV